MVEEKKEEFKFDRNSVILVLYLFFKMNLITRNNLKHAFKILEQPLPDGVLKYLAEEVGKAA